MKFLGGNTGSTGAGHFRGDAGAGQPVSVDFSMGPVIGDNARKSAVSGQYRLYSPANNSLKRAFSALIATTALALSACGDASDELPTAAAGAASMLPDHPAEASSCGPDGRFETELFGALEGSVSWSGAALACEGMPRPEERGARLRFSGSTAGIDLAFLISLPDLEAGSIAAELPSNVTLIEEGDGRFFSTSDLDSCWSDLELNEPFDDAGRRYRVAGTLYCIAPLAEVNGDASVTIEEAGFSGYVDWIRE